MLVRMRPVSGCVRCLASSVTAFVHPRWHVVAGLARIPAVTAFYCPELPRTCLVTWSSRPCTRRQVRCQSALLMCVAGSQSFIQSAIVSLRAFLPVRVGCVWVEPDEV